jgi:hypothetical protein
VEELFSPGIGAPVLDRSLILLVWELLRNNLGKEEFRRNLLRFSGVITEDRNDDGWHESEARYREGMIQEYRYDGDQDGIWDLRVYFSAGQPVRAETALLPEAGGGSAGLALYWERYPALFRAEAGGLRYLPRPLEFLFAPLRFVELGGTGLSGFRYPEADPRSPRLSLRSLVAFALTVEGPGREFEGAVERVELDRGIPRGASEWLGDRLVSVTEFIAGRPSVQRLDLDLDGRMETVRRFYREGEIPEEGPSEQGFPDYSRLLRSSESDWDGDGVYETGETYYPDGRTARSWDMDRDGVKDYTSISPEE